VGNPRGSASLRLIDRLAARPVLTIAAAGAVLDVSDVSAAKAIEELVAAGVLVKRSTGRRNQVFEARDIIDAFTDLIAFSPASKCITSFG
jgi:hypothetical protein